MDLWTWPPPAQVKVVSLVPSIRCKGVEMHLHLLHQSASCTFRPGPLSDHPAPAYSLLLRLRHAPSSLQDFLSLNPEGEAVDPNSGPLTDPLCALAVIGSP